VGWTLGVAAAAKGRALARRPALARGPVARTRTCAGSGGEVQRVARAEGRVL
jgi:hypothetical protein